MNKFDKLGADLALNYAVFSFSSFENLSFL